ncbi:MAG TPA: hypothetical protein VGE63_02350 [Candidatus Paceibacterota bacterium]
MKRLVIKVLRLGADGSPPVAVTITSPPIWKPEQGEMVCSIEEPDKSIKEIPMKDLILETQFTTIGTAQNGNFFEHPYF